MVNEVKELNNDIKPVLLEISERLWLRAKADAVLQNINLKDYVAQALEDKLNHRS
jgi:predicted HicB family RNase H-like nuclease